MLLIALVFLFFLLVPKAASYGAALSEPKIPDEYTVDDFWVDVGVVSAYPGVPPSELPRTTLAVSRDRALIILAEAIKQHEGYFPGSVAYDNHNPGALRSWPTMLYRTRGFAYFETYEIGWKALLDLLIKQCEKKPTLYQLMSWYAPVSDGNDPYRYASILASKLGVSVNTPIQDIYCR